MSDIDVAAGAAVRAHRLGRGFSQEELASKLQVHQSAFAKWERGSVPMRFRDVLGICSALSISIRELWDEPNNQDRYDEGVQRGLELSRQALEGISLG